MVDKTGRTNKEITATSKQGMLHFQRDYMHGRTDHQNCNNLWAFQYESQVCHFA